MSCLSVSQVDVDARLRGVVAGLVGEMVLACKESNTKTREAAYDSLLDLARSMDTADPPVHVPAPLTAVAAGLAGGTLAAMEDDEDAEVEGIVQVCG